MPPSFIEILGSSTGLVAASEMGDKTQLLAFSLAARFKRPFPILMGILVATVLNHALAAGLGVSVAAFITPRWSSQWLQWCLALLFFLFALWTLKPDTLDEDEAQKSSRWGAFVTTAILFFLAEMGDKTQLATVALGARFQSVLAVTLGTTLGMMLADGLAVFAGQSLSHRLPLQWIRRGAALLFALFALWILFQSS
jgi:putative Ca2+/H+ antiporter (TMEM165/GDT1 family)